MNRNAIIPAILLSTVLGHSAMAEELRIAVSGAPTSADPHFFLSGQNDQVRKYAYESLVVLDQKGMPQPQLAESWRMIDGTTWEFKMRPGVKFQDGSSLDALDVVYSVCRIRNNTGVGSFARYAAQMHSVEIPDPMTLIVKTQKPYPNLLSEFSLWAVMAAPADLKTIDLQQKDCGISSYPAQADFDAGKMPLGSGPYKLTSFTMGGDVRFVRFDDYWGEKQHWTSVKFSPITNAASRTAAFLSGDYDVVQGPAPQMMEQLQKTPNVKVASSPTYDVRYLMFDHHAEPSPEISGTDGKNPFKDVRVREAVSKAIDKEALVAKILNGDGVVATNTQGPESFGYDPDLKPVPFDPEQSKKLLAEAGYPNGFEVTLGVVSESEPVKIAQAVAQMMTRVGIKTNVDAMPLSVFHAKRGKFGFSLFTHTVGTRTAEMLTANRVLMGTPGIAPGFGGINQGRYSNPKLDALLLEAQTTMDDEQRAKILRQATKVAIDDHALVLLFQRVDNWAFKDKVTYTPRVDGYTIAQDVKPAR